MNGSSLWIDAHVHIAQVLMGFGSRGEFYPAGNGRARWLTGEEKQIVPPGLGEDAFTYEDLLRLMDGQGIERAVILQGPMLGFHNEYVAEAVRYAPDRLTGLGSFDPYCLESRRIMKRLTEDLGLKGFKFEISADNGLAGYHPDLDLRSECWTPVWETAQEKKLILSFDFGPLGGPSTKHIAQAAELAAACPGIIWVMEHSFLPVPGSLERFSAEVARMQKAENVFFTIATIPSNFKKEGYPYRGSWPFLRELKERVGAERILWGTDAPGTLFNTPYPGLKEYLPLSGVFTQEELAKVVRENALRLYWG